MPDYSRLSIKTTENRIDNAEDIIAFLQEIELDDNTRDYLDSLLNRLQNAPLENKEELMSAITSKLIEHKAKTEEELNNQETLRRIQEYNEDLKKLSVISTSRHDNDSQKDIDYIVFRNDDGTVEMLACHSADALNTFIKEHSEEVARKSAEEIFRYFKETVHRDVRFMNPAIMERDYPEISNQAVVNDEYIKSLELEEVEKYKERYNIPEEIEVGVDFEGERLYRMGDGIITFKTTPKGREMVVLKTPTLEQELEETVTEEAVIDTDVSSAPTEENINAIDMNSYAGMELDEFRNLVYDREVNHRILSPKEERAIMMYASLLISTMVERAQAGNDFEIQETLDDFMHDIIVRYEALKDGMLHSSEITQEEINLAEKYMAKQEEIKALNLEKKDVKRLILEHEEKRAGVSSIIIVLEIALLGLIIFSFISIL